MPIPLTLFDVRNLPFSAYGPSVFEILQKTPNMNQPPPLKRVAWTVTLKGPLTKQFTPQSHGDRKVYSLIRFPLRGRKTNNDKPYGNTDLLSQSVFLCAQRLSWLTSRCRSFLFWPLSRKENIFSLCELRDSSEAGGEKHSRTYPHSKAGTIPPQREGLMG